jgi:hypothetical protein
MTQSKPSEPEIVAKKSFKDTQFKRASLAILTADLSVS